MDGGAAQNEPVELQQEDLATASERSAPLKTTARWRYAAHTMGLLLVLLALVPLINNGSLAIPDEGVYTAQADNLAHGAWAQRRPTAEIDRSGDWFIVTGSLIVADDAIPYARRPLYPVMLTPFFGWFGVGGGLALSVLGTWVAACASAGLAADLNRRAILPTLWLVGLGSPLVFDAFLIVGHSWGAAFAAVCALALTRAQRPQGTAVRRLAWVALAMTAAALCTLARSEGVIAVLALAASMALISAIRRSQPGGQRAKSVWVATLVAAAGVAAYAVNDVWSKSITATAGVDATVADRMPNLLGAFWTGLLRPWYPNETAASASMAIVLLAAVAAPLIIRFVPRFRVLGIGLLVLASGASCYRAVTAPDLVSGFIPATPWLVIGVLSLRRRNGATGQGPALLLASAVATIAILATSYGFGGAVEWGGRFFHVLIPWLAPLGAVGLLELRKSLPQNGWFVAAAAIVTITASMTTIALRANANLRGGTAQFATFLQEVRADTPRDPVVWSTTSGDGTTRVLWQLSTEASPILTSEGLVNLPLLLDTLPGNIERVKVLTDIPTQKMLNRVTTNTRLSKWRVSTRTTGDLALIGYVLERQ